MKLNKLHLELKLPQLDLKSRLANLPLKDPEGYITDDGEEAQEQIIDTENNLEQDIDENEEAFTNTTITYNHNTDINTVINYGKSRDGWLWIGNITGNSEDPYESSKEAMKKLKCRYALHSFYIIKLIAGNILLTFVINNFCIFQVF